MCLSCEYNLGIDKGCSIGLNKEHKKWWENNKNIPINEITEKLSCYKNDLGDFLEKSNNKMEVLLKELKEIK